MQALAIPYAYKLTDWRQVAGAVAITGAVVASLFIHTFNTYWIAFQWVAILTAAVILRFKAPVNKSLVFLIGILSASAVLAMLGAMTANPKGLPLTIGQAVYFLPLTALAFVNIPRHTFKLIGFAAVVHALLVLFVDSTGFNHNANVAAGFLLFGAAILLHSKDTRPLGLIALLAIVFTDARLAAVAAVALIFVYILTGKLRGWKWFALGVGLVTATGVFFMLADPTIPLKDDVLARFGFVFGHNVDGFIQYEFALPGFMGHGAIANIGLHNVPARIAFEWGIVAAIAWLFVMGRGLTRNVFSEGWFLLLAMALVSTLDYYVMNAFLPLWMLAVNAQHRYNT